MPAFLYRRLPLCALLLLCSFFSADVRAIGADQPAETATFQLQVSLTGPPQLHVSIASRAGIRYRLRASDDLVAWRDVGPALTGDGSARSFSAPLSSAQEFFVVALTMDDSIVSQITGIEYPLRVYVPSGYSAAATKAYPVIYATDGQWYASPFSEAIAQKGKDIILVAIEQGPNDRRAIDYRLPAARDYLRFIVEELIPAVETVYRIDPKQRALSGASYGGLFVGLALLMDDAEEPVFSRYLSFDGSFYDRQSQLYALEQTRYDASRELNATLFLSSATVGPNNNYYVTQFHNRLLARGYAGLVIHRRSYPVTHNEIGPPSFAEALDLLY